MCRSGPHKTLDTDSKSYIGANPERLYWLLQVINVGCQETKVEVQTLLERNLTFRTLRISISREKESAADRLFPINLSVFIYWTRHLYQIVKFRKVIPNQIENRTELRAPGGLLFCIWEGRGPKLLMGIVADGPKEGSSYHGQKGDQKGRKRLSLIPSRIFGRQNVVNGLYT